MSDFTGPTIYLKPRKARPIWHGHSWIYGGAIARTTRAPVSGAIVEVADDREKVIGYGIWDEAATIRVRMLGVMSRWPEGWPPDRLPTGFWRGRLSRALGRRRRLGYPGAKSNTYRLVNADGDGLPGVIVDQFGDTCVISLMTAALEPHLPALVGALNQVVAPQTIIVETHDSVLREASGIAMPVAEARIGGAKIAFEPLTPHRPHRLDVAPHLVRFGALCRGARVLDAYSHEGIASIAAANAGPEHLISLATSSGHLTQTRRNAQLNSVSDSVDLRRGVPPDAMRRWLDRGRRFDRICLDPTLDLNQGAARPPLKELESLVIQAIRILDPGGLLAVFSRAATINPAELGKLLSNAGARTRRSTGIVEIYHPLGDHPSPAAMPEVRAACGVLAEVG